MRDEPRPPWTTGLFAALLAGIFTVALSAVGFLDRANLTVSDIYARIANVPVSGETIVVAIDEKTVTMLGGYPLAREHLAAMLEHLETAGARRVFLDATFGYQGAEATDARLATAMRRLGPDRLALPTVTLSVKDGSGGTKAIEIAPIDRFSDAAHLVSADLPFALDGRVRSVGLDSLDRQSRRQTVAAWLSSVEAAGSSNFRIDYGIELGALPVFSFIDVLKGDVLPGRLSGRNVIVGLNVGGEIQSVSVPRYGDLYRPQIFALSAETLRQGRMLKLMNPWLGVIATLGITALLGPWLWRYGAIFGAALTLSAILGLFLLGASMRQNHATDLAIAAPCLAAFLSYLAVQIALNPALARFRHAFHVALERVDLAHIKLLQAGNDAIVTFNPEGDILTVNKAAEAMFGVKADEAQNFTIFDFLPDHGEALMTRSEARSPGRLHARLPDPHGAPRYFDLSFNTLQTGESWVGMVSARDITALKSREEHLAHAAMHDSLTGLANRRGFDTFLDATATYATETGQEFALLLVDLDEFKPINDTLGHHVGDEVLEIIAKRIRRLIRKSDIAARVGGDEFAIIMQAPTSLENATDFAQKLIRTVSQSIDVDGRVLSVGASVGIAIHGRHADDPESLLQFADAAMYVAKARGDGGFAVAEDASSPVAIQ